MVVTRRTIFVSYKDLLGTTFVEIKRQQLRGERREKSGIVLGSILTSINMRKSFFLNNNSYESAR